MTNHSNKPQTEAGAQVEAAKNQPQDASQVQEHNPEAPDTELPPFNYEEVISELQSQLAEHQDQLLRAKAEVENIRRRAQEDVSKARKFGIESFAESLIPVKDSLEAALEQPEQDTTSWQEGVETTLRQLTSSFERNALKEVAPSVGDLFDPHLHQAISSVPSDQPEGTVAQLLQKGYTIADRVLRPALVMVSAAKS